MYTRNTFYILHASPLIAMSSRIEYEAYWHKDATDEEFNNINPIYKEVLGKGKDLCGAAQKNLGAGIFIDAEFHPKNEKARSIHPNRDSAS